MNPDTNQERSAGRKKVFAVCGPTASGKSELADYLAESLGESVSTRVPTIVVDSMQVYREIPIITNQARRRPAELVGIVSVADEWTVARHRDAALEILGEANGPAVLDGGTGMYLNAILLNIEMAPRVPPEIRERASRMARDAANPRRETRALELRISGSPPRSSIWDAESRHDTTLIYLRPERSGLDEAISRRTDRIVAEGREEARMLLDIPINASVAESIGVRELMDHASGSLSAREARERISARTRKLARRQMQWFDKLARQCPHNGMRAIVLEDRSLSEYMQCMHDIITE